ncbi:MAG: class I SAM-dependent methyltransferase [Lentisphaeria bacterium]
MSSADQQYQLLDAGNGRKLEKFGPYVLDRPCAQAVWRQTRPLSFWQKADASFTREQKDNRWTFQKRLPSEWVCELNEILFRIELTDFGHVGVFPEHAFAWREFQKLAKAAKRPLCVLNLFAYSGGATLAAASVKAEVCHLDASKKMVDWARKNAALNHLEEAPIRWIIDDVQKFLSREIRRKRQYDFIILDPPSFGRGTNKELFQIDDNMLNLLELCRQVLGDQPVGVLLSCHTPGYTPTVLTHLLSQIFKKGKITAGEMLLEAVPPALSVPSGTYALLNFEN